MRSRLKILGWLGVMALGAVSGCALYVGRRGGSYPRHEAASFAALSAPVARGRAAGDPAAGDPAAGDPVVPLVQSDAGVLRGAVVGSAASYRGIPYARPPVGALRWEAPQPAAPWTGVRDATRYDGACMQVRSGLTSFFAPMAKAYGSRFEQDPVPVSEDCLYLSVWAPAAPPSHPLPVMVWLHGGSNRVGSGTQTTYDGASLAARGVVLVTINYRLGAFGFFSHPELTAASPHHGSGNYGLLDQLAALRWVQRNVARFGGDPQNVTLFGESAGAIDAAMLMASPLAAGLFRRVISESGPPFGTTQTLAEANAFGSVVGALATGDAHATPLQRLRALPAADIERLVAEARRRVGGDAGAFTVDGWVLPRSAQRAFATGAIQKVDLLVGFNAREFSAFRLGAAAAAAASGTQNGGWDPGILRKLSDAARPYYGSWTTPIIARYVAGTLVDRDAGIDAAAGDLLAACPIAAMAALTDAAGQRVFAYRFDRTIPGSGAAELGAFHSLEVPYVFGALDDRSWKWLPFTPDDAALSNVIQTYWTNFAKTGDPNASGLPRWPVWSDEQKEFLVIERDGSISAQRNYTPLASRLSAGDLRKRFGAG